MVRDYNLEITVEKFFFFSQVAKVVRRDLLRNFSLPEPVSRGDKIFVMYDPDMRHGKQLLCLGRVEGIEHNVVFSGGLDSKEKSFITGLRLTRSNEDNMETYNKFIEDYTKIKHWGML